MKYMEQKFSQHHIKELNAHIKKLLKTADSERDILNTIYTELEESLTTAQRALNGYTDIKEIKKDAISSLNRFKDNIDPTYNTYINQFGKFLDDVSLINNILKQKEDIDHFTVIHAQSLSNRGKENQAREMLFHKIEKLQKSIHEMESGHTTLSKLQELLQEKFEEFTADIKHLQVIAQKRMDDLHNDWHNLGEKFSKYYVDINGKTKDGIGATTTVSNKFQDAETDSVHTTNNNTDYDLCNIGEIPSNSKKYAINISTILHKFYHKWCNLWKHK